MGVPGDGGMGHIIVHDQIDGLSSQWTAPEREEILRKFPCVLQPPHDQPERFYSMFPGAPITYA